MKVCGVVPAESIQADLKTHVIDAINVVNTIVPKPSWIETGDDLAKEFLRRVDKRCPGAEVVATAFDTYRDVSLKYTTRKDCYKKVLMSEPVGDDRN